jgi:hypothetical protein
VPNVVSKSWRETFLCCVDVLVEADTLHDNRAEENYYISECETPAFLFESTSLGKTTQISRIGCQSTSTPTTKRLRTVAVSSATIGADVVTSLNNNRNDRVSWIEAHPINKSPGSGYMSQCGAALVSSFSQLIKPADQWRVAASNQMQSHHGPIPNSTINSGLLCGHLIEANMRSRLLGRPSFLSGGRLR